MTTSICPWAFRGIPFGKRGIPGIRGNPACDGLFPLPPPKAWAKPDNARSAADCWRRTLFELPFAEADSESEASVSVWNEVEPEDCAPLFPADDEPVPVPKIFGIPCESASATPAKKFTIK